MTTDTQTNPFAKLAPAGLGALVLGGAGLFGALAADAKVAAQSYLFGYIVFFCFVMGAFGLTLLQHTVKARWGRAVLRLYEAAGGPMAIIALAVAFIPIVLWMPTLYKWMDPTLVAEDHIVHAKTWYLNQGFFLVRAGIYFLSWFLIAFYLQNSSRRQDRTGDPDELARRTNVSSVSLVWFVITVNFAVTDWVMSLEPHWFSTVFGVWFVAGMALCGLSFGTVMTMKNVQAPEYRDVVRKTVMKDLGNLMFAFTMFWCYITVSQFLIIWSANLPEFITFYVARRAEGWNYLITAIVIFQFFVPFVALLAPRVKRNAGSLASVAMLIGGMRILDYYMIVMPDARKGSNVIPHWGDLAALVFFAGLFLTVFVTQVRRAPLIPNHVVPELSEVPQHA